MAVTHAAQETALAAGAHGAHDADDSHGHEDPNAAPMRADVRAQFSSGAIVFCAVLAAVAIVAGTVIGLTVINN